MKEDRPTPGDNYVNRINNSTSSYDEDDRPLSPNPWGWLLASVLGLVVWGLVIAIGICLWKAMH